MNISIDKLLTGLAEFQPELMGYQRKIFFTAFKSSITFNSLFGAEHDTATRTIADNLFVLKASELPDYDFEHVSGVVCIVDSPNADYSVIKAPLILLKVDANIEHVFSKLLETILADHKYDDLKETLLNMLSDGYNLDDILKTASRYLDNPFSFINASFRIVAHSFTNDISSPSLKKSLETGYVYGETLVALRTSGVLGKIMTSSAIARYTLPYGTNKITIGLRPHGQYVGLLSMYDNVRPINESDEEMLEYLSKIVSSLISKNPQYFNSSGTSYDSLVNDLIFNESATNKISAGIQNMELQHPAQMRALFVAPPEEESAVKNVPLRVILEQLDTILYNSKKVVLGERGVLCILDATKVRLLSNETHAELVKYLRRNSLFAACSNTFEDFLKLKAYYDQAQIAMLLGCKYSPEERLYFYHDYAILHILSISSEHYDPMMLSHPALLTLQKYDQKYNTDYLDTLKVYIDCDRNMAECAKQLNIHYNTARYRIKMIHSLGNIDLSDLKTFLHLYLSFEMMKIK